MERVLADAHMLDTSQAPKEAPGWPFDPKSWIFKDLKARERYKSNILENEAGEGRVL